MLWFSNATLLSALPQRGMGAQEMNLVPAQVAKGIPSSDTAPSSTKCDWGPSWDEASLTKPERGAEVHPTGWGGCKSERGSTWGLPTKLGSW